MLRGLFAGVTFVTFARGSRADAGANGVTFHRASVTFGGDGNIPGAGKVRMARPGAQSIGTFAGHSDGGRGVADAMGLVQG
jgi:hypothetical protein